MDDPATLISIPESVHRYMTSSRLQSAVDLLLSGKSPKTPDGLQWDELQDFYRACLAAQQTRIEWAMTIELFWTAVFADQVSGWRPSGIKEQYDDSELRIDVQHLWDESEFARDLSRGGYYMEALVELDVDAGVRIAVCLYKDGSPVDLPPVAGSTRIEEWIYSAWEPITEDPRLDCTRLRGAARAALNAVESAARAVR